MKNARVRNAADLAKRIGVADATVSRWKEGGAQPQVDVCRRLATVLGVPVLEVLVAAGHLTRSEAQLKDVRGLPDLPPVSAREALIGDDSLDDDVRAVLLAAYDAAQRTEYAVAARTGQRRRRP